MLSPVLTRRRAVRALLSGLGAVACVGGFDEAFAQTAPVVFEGQSFDRRMVVAGSELQLNGLGIRQVAWFKGYLAALYLAAPASTADQVQAARGAKRIQLRVLYEVPATEFAKAVRKGMLRNITPDQQRAINERLDRFVTQIEAVGKVRKHDVINLDFDPGRGLVLYVNTVIRGEPIPGEDFYSALLRSFVGVHPYDEKMRDGLLGKLA